MGRDLMQRPQGPVVYQEEEVTPGPKKAEKLGVKLPSRDIGGAVDTEDPVLSKLLTKLVEAKEAKETQEAKGPQEGKAPQEQAKVAKKKLPAFKAAYFNKDVDSARGVNQRSTQMAALRGSKEATDLRKIVLPQSHLVDTPDPINLGSSFDRMGVLEGDAPSFSGLLQNMSSKLREKGMTAQRIEEMMKVFEEMVSVRMAAIKRMQAAGVGGEQSVTLEVALETDGNNVENSEDLTGEGAELIRRTAGQAEGMHRSIAKTLGLKMP